MLDPEQLPFLLHLHCSVIMINKCSLQKTINCKLIQIKLAVFAIENYLMQVFLRIFLKIFHFDQ
ncbi:hypothetical protein T12_14305 [Trichinella patagoniensis]|uniref:Uncharacterized protein n=1 Tax=Trichinella patagoniensis TaxID=990121 RepID=A0A0V1AAJ7_9BILA|nr:hypothetical protein T12_14305 [Trichinella patagoniensis]